MGQYKFKCPICGKWNDILCVPVDDKTHKTHTTDETQPSSEAYEARIAELTAFVRKVGASKEMEGHDNGYGGWELNPWYDEARALLRGESEDGK